MMKRYREEDNYNNMNNLANVLILLSGGGGGGGGGGDDQTTRSRWWLSNISNSPVVARVFECKTCNRQFQSFQALGGHRASHKKPPKSVDIDQARRMLPIISNRKVHECSVCGLEFATGQALGGHMRRHYHYHCRGAAGGFVVENKSSSYSNGKRKRVMLDLNLPPFEI